MEEQYIELENNIILKIGNPKGRHAIINTASSKKLLAYKSIKEDLQQVLKAVKELKTNKSLNELLKESLTYYITISYGKCFAEAKVRGTKLDRKDLVELDEEYLNLHDVLKEIRDNHVAHAGSEEYSKNYLVIEFDQLDLNRFRIYRSSLNLSSFNFNLEAIETLITKIIGIVDNKAQRKLDMLKKEISELETKTKLLSNSFIPADFDVKTFKEIKSVLKPLKSKKEL